MLETVAEENPLSFATSRIVIVFFGFRRVNAVLPARTYSFARRIATLPSRDGRR
jgi:hypothetical protein